MSQNADGRKILGASAEPGGHLAASQAGLTPLGDPALRAARTRDANYERSLEVLDALGFQLICSDQLRATRVTSGRLNGSPLFGHPEALEAGHLRQLLEVLPLAEAFPELVQPGSGTGSLPTTSSRWEEDGTGILVLDAREQDRGLVITPQGAGALLDVLMGGLETEGEKLTRRLLALRWDVRITNSHQPYLDRDVYTLPTLYAPALRNHPEWKAPLSSSVLLPGVMVPAGHEASTLWGSGEITDWRPACLLNLELLFSGDPPPPIGFPPPPPPGGGGPGGDEDDDDDEVEDPLEGIEDYLDDLEIEDLIGAIEQTLQEADTGTGVVTSPEGTPIPEEDEDDLDGSDSPQERNPGTPHKGLAQLAQDLLAWAQNAGVTFTGSAGQVLDLVNLVGQLAGKFGGAVPCPTATSTRPNVVISEGTKEDGTSALLGKTSDGQTVEIRGEPEPTPEGAAALQALQNKAGASRVGVYGQPGSAVDLRDQVKLMGLQLDSVTKMVQALLVGDASGFAYYAGNLAAISTNQLGMGASKHVLGQHLIDPDDENEIPEAVKVLQVVEGRTRGATMNRPGFRVERHTKGDVVAGQPLIDLRKVTEDGATDTGDYMKAGDFSVKNNGVAKATAVQVGAGQQSTIESTGYGYVADANGDPVFMKAGTEVSLTPSTGGSSPLFGDGSDGAATISSNTQLTSGNNFKQYTSLTINSSVTLAGAQGEPLVIRCTGDCTINGTLSMNGRGLQAGAGADGSFAGAAPGATDDAVEPTDNGEGAAFAMSAAGGGGGGGSGASIGPSATTYQAGDGSGGVNRGYAMGSGGGAAGKAGGAAGTPASPVANGNPPDGDAADATNFTDRNVVQEWLASAVDVSFSAIHGGAPGGGGGGGGGATWDNGFISTPAFTLQSGSSGGAAPSISSATDTGAGSNGTAGDSATSTLSGQSAISDGGGGGGGGNGGGVVALYVEGTLTIGGSGSITANGGAGGNGGNSGGANASGVSGTTYAASGGAGGGGGGGGGGLILVLYGAASGVTDGKFSVSGGTGGTAGAQGGASANTSASYGGAGAAGGDGEAGYFAYRQAVPT